MSNLVFPYYLPGLNFSDSKIPIAGSTGVTRSVAGQRSTIAKAPWPRWRWKVSWEWLDDTQSRTNVLAWSQDFSQTGWSTGQGGVGLAPITEFNYVGAAAPDGTYTADRIYFNLGGGVTSGDFSRLVQSYPSATTNATYTFSIWLRTVSGTATVLLQETNGNSWTQLITVTSAWKRFTVTAVANSTTMNPNVLLRGSPQTSNSVDLLLWGAQLELGSQATNYIPTNASSPALSDAKTLTGFVNSMKGQYDTFLWLDPDFNSVTQQQFGTGTGSQTSYQLQAQYSTDGASLGTGGAPDIVQNFVGTPIVYVNRYASLAERMSPTLRTNLCLQSQDLTTTWTVSGATITANTVTDPAGNATGDSLVENSLTSQHYVTQTGIVVPSAIEDVTFSVFVLPSTRTWFYLEFYDGTSFANAWFNLPGSGAAGSVGTLALTGTSWANVRAKVELCNSGHSWYRITITACKAGAATSLQVVVGSATADNTLSFLGNGATAGQIAWAQAEVGSNPTMYLPTTSSTVSATDYTVGPTGIVSFTAAPANNAKLLWTGSFYYRAAFTSDEPLDLTEFANRMWDASSNSQVELESEWV